jgi:hypothetical protein
MGSVSTSMAMTTSMHDSAGPGIFVIRDGHRKNKPLAAIAAVFCFLGTCAYAQALRTENTQQRLVSNPETAQMQQVRQGIVDLYLSDFRREVELTEEQFLKLNPLIREFIQERFRRANQRQQLKQRQDHLLSQRNPGEADVQRLSEDQERFESETATLENRFVAGMRSDLTARQALLVRRFNRTFFEEKLPGLIERARVAAAEATRGQQQRPAATRGGNPNRRKEPARSGNALRQTGR